MLQWNLQTLEYSRRRFINTTQMRSQGQGWCKRNEKFGEIRGWFQVWEAGSLAMNQGPRDPGETGYCAWMVSPGQSVTWSLWRFGFSSSERESPMPIPNWCVQELFQVHRVRCVTWGHPSLVTGWELWTKPSLLLFLACLQTARRGQCSPVRFTVWSFRPPMCESCRMHSGFSAWMQP